MDHHNLTLFSTRNGCLSESRIDKNRSTLRYQHRILEIFFLIRWNSQGSRLCMAFDMIVIHPWKKNKNNKTTTGVVDMIILTRSCKSIWLFRIIITYPAAHDLHVSHQVNHGNHDLNKSSKSSNSVSSNHICIYVLSH